MHNVFYYKFSRIEFSLHTKKYQHEKDAEVSKNLVRSKNKFVISQDLNITLLDYQNNYVGYSNWLDCQNL